VDEHEDASNKYISEAIVPTHLPDVRYLQQVWSQYSTH